METTKVLCSSTVFNIDNNQKCFLIASVLPDWKCSSVIAEAQEYWFGSNFRIMVGSASGPGSTFKAFLGSARFQVPLSNKIRVRVGSVQHIYGSLRRFLDP